MPITCRVCKKYAKLKAVFMNGLDEIKLAGSCKRCGYDEQDHYPEGTKFQQIPRSKITYDAFEELGVEDR